MKKVKLLVTGLFFLTTSIVAYAGCCPGPCCRSLHHDAVYSNLIKAKVPYKTISVMAQKRADMYKAKQQALNDILHKKS